MAVLSRLIHLENFNQISGSYNPRLTFNPSEVCASISQLEKMDQWSNTSIDQYLIFIDPLFHCWIVPFSQNIFEISTKSEEVKERRVWAVPFSLATTQGIAFAFFSSATEMFQFAE